MYVHVYDYVHVHIDLENNHEERLQCRRQLYKQLRDRKMKEEREVRLSRQHESMWHTR